MTCSRTPMKVMVFIAIFALALSAGCAVSVGPAYSVLDPVAPANGPVAMTQGRRLLVAVGPIDVPGYVDRAATIVETTINPANISTVDMRASLLKREIPGVITENLRRLLAPRSIAVVPLAAGKNADYRIEVKLSTFDIINPDTLDTRARWVLYGSDGKTPVTARDVSFSTVFRERGDAGAREAMSRSLAALSRSIVTDLEAAGIVRTQ